MFYNLRNLTVLFLILISLFSCIKQQEAIGILQKSINTIDTIETIYYKQDMTRTNPRNTGVTISRYREMYFSRLITDSIVGVKGHWYMYIDDKDNVIYEDIYDGNRLIRKNNKDSIARVYDLVKYPNFRDKHFWSHNTLYGMQYEFKFILNNREYFIVEKLNDTVIFGRNCYQIRVKLEDQVTMPGFAISLTDNIGSISKTTYSIDKYTFFPMGMYSEFYTEESPEEIVFLKQTYYDLVFNQYIDEKQFETSGAHLFGFEIKEMLPY